MGRRMNERVLLERETRAPSPGLCAAGPRSLVACAFCVDSSTPCLQSLEGSKLCWQFIAIDSGAAAKRIAGLQLCSALNY